MGRPKEPLIQVARVIETALDLIDEVGLEGLSMRELGKKLGVNPASLYHHFHNKEDILQAVREHITRKAKVPSRIASKPWYEQLMILGKAYRAALTKHPNAAFLVASSNPARARMGGHHLYEGVIASMLKAKFTEREAILTLVGIEIIASGSVMEEMSMGRQMLFGNVDASRFPSLDLATHGKPLDINVIFPAMLAMFIDGAKTRLIARKHPALGSLPADNLEDVKGTIAPSKVSKLTKTRAVSVPTEGRETSDRLTKPAARRAVTRRPLKQ